MSHSWPREVYTVGSTTLTLAPVNTGIQGGLSGGPMTMTGTYSATSSVPPGIWPIAYIIATGNVNVTGILASGQNGFRLDTGVMVPESMKGIPQSATLYYQYNGFITPEPSTIALAGMAFGSLVVWTWRRRRLSSASCRSSAWSRQRETLVKVRAVVAFVSALAIAASADAAKLVVIATNSGTTPNTATGVPSTDQPPVDPPGAKGFLIGLDLTTDPENSMRFILTFSGPNLVQRLAPNSASAELLATPDVQSRLQEFANVNDPVPGSHFGNNDSWWWDAPQTIGSTTSTLNPVQFGYQGGLPGGPMTLDARFTPGPTVAPGIWRVAYIVATGDVDISGIIAAGQIGYGPAGNQNQEGGVARLDFASGQIVPEPPTSALAGAGLVGLALVRRKRRRSVVRKC